MNSLLDLDLDLARGLRLSLAALAMLAAGAPCLAAPPTLAPPPASLAHGLFSDVRVHRPAGATRHFVLMLTQGTTPSAREQAMLRAMVDADAMVATVPFAPFYRRLARQDGRCTYGPGAFENLARYLQAYEQVPGYLPPVVAGADGTASYVHALLLQAPAGTFAAGLGLAPRPLALKPPPCPPTKQLARAGRIVGRPWRAGGPG